MVEACYQRYPQASPGGAAPDRRHRAPWHKVHAEADRWEHVISDDVEARLVEVLGNPKTCPHGSPIPGSGGDTGTGDRSGGSTVGDRVRLSRVTELVEVDQEALIYLDTHGFIPGVGRRP